MPLQMTATGVTEVGPGLWLFDMPPHQVRHFGATTNATGQRSVVVFRACTYDAARAELSFQLDDVVPVNVGTSPRALGVLAELEEATSEPQSVGAASMQSTHGPGDRDFLQLAKSELSDGSARAAEKLLLGVRAKSAGDLKRGQARNFSETPDNFWYVIVQPRVDELSITIRGPVSRFRGLTPLEVKDDRGNTRFKVRSEQDVPAALKLIFHAVRKS